MWKDKIKTGNKVIENEFGIIYLLKGKNPNGNQHYCYIFVEIDKIENFIKAEREQEKFYPNEYGKILLHSHGIPTDNELREIKEKFKSVVSMDELLEKTISVFNKRS